MSNLITDAIIPGIPGSGIDADEDRRPGVPMELDPPRPAGASHWREPERQPDPGNILKRKGLEELTPVFGTANPPRGLSGLLRRYAYTLPEHTNRHWLFLMFADRVDVIEHNPGRSLRMAVPLMAGAVAWWALRQRD